MKRRAVLVPVVLVLAFSVPANAGVITITPVIITDIASGFQPRQATVRVGMAVGWQNDDDVAHTTTGQGPVTPWARTLQPGKGWERRFHQVGGFPYICTLHTSMKGAVRVPILMPSSVLVNEMIQLRVASSDAPTGFEYQIQRRRPGGTWTMWRQTTGKTTTWTPGIGALGEWRFRARTKRLSNGAVSGWSPARHLTVVQ